MKIKSKYVQLAIAMGMSAMMENEKPPKKELEVFTFSARKFRENTRPSEVYLPEPSKPFQNPKKLSRKARKKLKSNKK